MTVALEQIFGRCHPIYQSFGPLHSQPTGGSIDVIETMQIRLGRTAHVHTATSYAKAMSPFHGINRFFHVFLAGTTFLPNTVIREGLNIHTFILHLHHPRLPRIFTFGIDIIIHSAYGLCDVLEYCNGDFFVRL
jgi:hypothetical protein